MLKFSVIMHRKNPGYEVKSVVTYRRLQSDDTEKEEIKDILANLRNKLEKIVPSNLKFKYNLISEDLIITARPATAGEAQSLVQKMAIFIKSAGKALDLL